MQARFIKQGDCIDYTPGADIALGQVVVQGELVGVAHKAIASGILGSLMVEGVAEFTKKVAASEGQVVGSLWYWDDTNNYATKSAASGANKLIGKSVSGGTGDNDTTVRIKLNQ